MQNWAKCNVKICKVQIYSNCKVKVQNSASSSSIKGAKVYLGKKVQKYEKCIKGAKLEKGAKSCKVLNHTICTIMRGAAAVSPRACQQFSLSHLNIKAK